MIPDEKDPIFKSKLKVNIKFAQKFFEERNLNYDISFIEHEDFEKSVLKHSEKINADLIAIMNINKGGILPGLITKPEEYLLTNDANIPILILNPTVNISSLFY